MVPVVGVAATILGHSVRLLWKAWPHLLRTLGFAGMTYTVWLYHPRLTWGLAGAAAFALGMSMRRPSDRRRA